MQKIQKTTSYSSDSSNDSDDEQEKLKKIFKRFNSNSDATSNLGELGNTEQYLLDALNEDSNICLICIEKIGNKDPIWSCSCCFAQFHLTCIQKWIRDGSYLNALNQDDSQLNINRIPWNCPKCRTEYEQSNFPSVYYCYCGQERDPKYDPWVIPHSCNQRCDKQKPCGHRCLILCHPGPCPSCPQMVSITCYCAKSSAVSRRCANKYWSCNKECNRLLACKQHPCKSICHPGDCPSCEKTSVQFCVCKKFKKEVLCTNSIWKCEEKCSKMYSCGNHKCEVVCHSGDCGLCPRSLLRTCPCGKSKSQKPCTEDIPTCGDTCEKQLDCGIHKCVRRCHQGPCDTCRQIRLKRCRCGQHQKELPCCTVFTCESKCSKIRNCGKHKCNRKCCDGNCSACEQTCNKQLQCKNHKCNMLCHRGPCYPCPLMVDIFCPCGGSKLRVPCAMSKSNIKVPCKQLCKKPPDCHHEKRLPHKCHSGDCPPCKQKCNQILGCKHICEAKCHTAVLTEIVENKVRDGPWVPINKKKVVMKYDCPPCMQPIKTECLGKHEITDVPCHRAIPYNCGRHCGLMLKCTHHKCELDCHEVKRENDQSINCQECERDCEQERPIGCEHSCPNGLCHPGTCKPCKILLRMKCHNGDNVLFVECQKWVEASEEEKDKMKSCKVPCTKSLDCGHQCTLLCHSGACSKYKDCQEKVTVKCACKTIKKTFLCKEIFKKNSSKGFVIDCNEKCKGKMINKKSSLTTTVDKIEEIDKEIKTTKSVMQSSNNANTSNNFLKNSLIALSLFVLLLSVFLYIYIE